MVKCPTKERIFNFWMNKGKNGETIWFTIGFLISLRVKSLVQNRPVNNIIRLSSCKQAFYKANKKFPESSACPIGYGIPSLHNNNWGCRILVKFRNWAKQMITFLLYLTIELLHYTEKVKSEAKSQTFLSQKAPFIKFSHKNV